MNVEVSVTHHPINRCKDKQTKLVVLQIPLVIKQCFGCLDFAIVLYTGCHALTQRHWVEFFMIARQV